MLRHVELGSRYKRTVSVLEVRDREYEPVIHDLGFGSKGLKVISALEPLTGATTGVATAVGQEPHA